MNIYTLLIINKSGGLVYNKEFGDDTSNRLDVNEVLTLAGVWHSMHAISSQLSPVSGCSGIELLEAETFDLHCMQALTGIKLLIVASPKAEGIPTLLQRVYELYCDYVMKNPFHEVDMRIRCKLFDQYITKLTNRYPAFQ